jgi:hypothetical protein
MNKWCRRSIACNLQNQGAAIQPGTKWNRRPFVTQIIYSTSELPTQQLK